MQVNATQVLLLTDENRDTPYVEDMINISAELIRAAKDDRLVTIVCEHNMQGHKATVLCAMMPGLDGATASYIPIAQVFDQYWSSWTELQPPKCAVTPKYEH